MGFELLLCGLVFVCMWTVGTDKDIDRPIVGTEFLEAVTG